MLSGFITRTGFTCALLLFAQTPASNGEAIARIAVDGTKTNGSFRAIHGCNGGPVTAGGMIDVSDFHRQAGFTRQVDVRQLGDPPLEKRDPRLHEPLPVLGRLVLPAFPKVAELTSDFDDYDIIPVVRELPADSIEFDTRVHPDIAKVAHQLGHQANQREHVQTASDE